VDISRLHFDSHADAEHDTVPTNQPADLGFVGSLFACSDDGIAQDAISLLSRTAPKIARAGACLLPIL
jgi:hypothetical protein